MKDNKIYIFLDTETTGLSPHKGAELLEFAGIKYKNNKEIDRLHIFIKPNIFSSPTQSVDFKDVKDADKIEIVIKNIRKFIGEDIIVAYNAPFDVKFLNYYSDNYFENNEVLDLLKIAKNKVKKGETLNYKQSTILKYFNIEVDKTKTHTALYDTEKMIELYIKLN